VGGREKLRVDFALMEDGRLARSGSGIDDHSACAPKLRLSKPFTVLKFLQSATKSNLRTLS
jgi:hypothetical protein